jgi:hypothetical protein
MCASSFVSSSLFFAEEAGRGSKNEMKKEKQYERNKKKKTSTSCKNKRTDGWRRKIKIENVEERGKEE